MACLTRPSLQQTSRASTKHFWVLSTCTLHRPPGDPENSSLNLTTHYFFCKNDWGLSRRGGSAAHSYLFGGSWHARCLLLPLFYWFFPLFSLPPPLPPSQINPADGPGWPVGGTREAPLPHKGMNGSRQSTFTAETRKHCWAERYHVKHLQYQALNSTYRKEAYTPLCHGIPFNPNSFKF